jgi:hypothetical protein
MEHLLDSPFAMHCQMSWSNLSFLIHVQKHRFYLDLASSGKHNYTKRSELKLERSPTLKVARGMHKY